MGTYAGTQYPFDAALQLHDGAAATTAAGFGQVAGVPFVFDTMAGSPGLGSPVLGEPARYGAVAVVAVSAAGTSETVTIEASNDPTFATGVVTVATVTAGATAGEYAAPFNNDQGGTRYRYLRARFTTVNGSYSQLVFLAPRFSEGY